MDLPRRGVVEQLISRKRPAPAGHSSTLFAFQWMSVQYWCVNVIKEDTFRLDETVTAPKGHLKDIRNCFREAGEIYRQLKDGMWRAITYKYYA